MKTFAFDNKEFGRGYALPFTWLQLILGLGFLFVVVILILPANTVTIPDALLPVAYVLIPLSMVGFPAVTVIKHGYRKLLRNSELTGTDSGLTYRRLTEMHWTLVGHVQEYRITEALNIDHVAVSKRYYICYGQFSEEVVNNGRSLHRRLTAELKIPRAYSAMERIKDYGKH